MIAHINTEEQPHSNQARLMPSFVNRPHVRANRLNKAQVQEARSRRIKETQMWLIIREFLSCLFFLCIVYTISNSNRNNKAYLQVNHLRHFFMNSGDSRYDYTKVRI